MLRVDTVYSAQLVTACRFFDHNFIMTQPIIMKFGILTETSQALPHIKSQLNTVIRQYGARHNGAVILGRRDTLARGVSKISGCAVVAVP